MSPLAQRTRFRFDNPGSLNHDSPMFRVILHIGSHKTGTSFLQQHLHFNSEALLDSGIYYPQLRATPYAQQHSSLAIALRSSDKSAALGMLTEICDKAEDRQAHTLLLSGEAFFFATQEEVNTLRHALEERGNCEFRILVYLRNTYDYVRSQLNQHLRFGDYPFTENEFTKRLGIYRPDEIIQCWESVFGEENVGVFSYDEHKEGLLDHFTEVAGVPRLQDCPHAAETLNPSVDFLCALIMNQLLFARDSSLKASVYSQLIANRDAPADLLYPSEAAMIESVLEQLAITLNHPKLRQIENYLRGTPTVCSSSGSDTTSIERLMMTSRIIQSVLERDSATRRDGIA